jgi:hypothetical protein
MRQDLLNKDDTIAELMRELRDRIGGTLEQANQIDELRRENEQLRAESQYIAATAIGYEKSLVSSNDENDRLRAELARIKPSWDDAPEWAVKRIVHSQWVDEHNQTKDIEYTLENRP